MIIPDYEDTRLDMMGIGISGPTPEQNRLRTIILCRPITRRFAGSQADRLFTKQLRYFDLRSQFVIATSSEAVREIGEELLALDAELSDKQDVSDLA